MNKIFTISLFANVLFGGIYWSFFHSVQVFDHQGISEALASLNREETYAENAWINNYIRDEALKSKRVLRDVLPHVIKMDSLLKSDLPKHHASLSYEDGKTLYSEINQKMRDLFEASITGKFSYQFNSEMEKMDERHFKQLQNSLDELPPIPESAREAAWQYIDCQINNIARECKIAILNYGQPLCIMKLMRRFPIFVPEFSSVRKGEMFKATILLSGENEYASRHKVFVNGEEIQINAERKGIVRIPTHQSGWQKLQIISHSSTDYAWEGDSILNRIQMDTSYFNYFTKE